MSCLSGLGSLSTREVLYPSLTSPSTVWGARYSDALGGPRGGREATAGVRMQSSRPF